DQIIAYARTKMGTKGYNILYNNCEHFANECVFGEKICRQAEDIRALFRSIPVVDVYFAQLPANEPIGEVECKARREEIASVSNERVKREKYFVWKLLCYALERSFGIRGKKLDFKKESYGGWSVSDACFSLSHSGNALAVAVSRDPVGVDIELLHAPKSDKMSHFMMNGAEISLLSGIDSAEKDASIIKTWTAKEAIFKSQRSDAFMPKEIDTTSASFKSGSIAISDETYVWSVATATPEKIRIFSDIDLTKIK
ncbi:MAG: 4'-phosphopantetheinyl transferase superfamily protein, partial [Clostridia bacterium]|nr:4'-phosphopantetheinyl transferase superfamily protein [Clostridia bacterium]